MAMDIVLNRYEAASKLKGGAVLSVVAERARTNQPWLVTAKVFNGDHILAEFSLEANAPHPWSAFGDAELAAQHYLDRQ